MLTPGQTAPDFQCEALSGLEFRTVKLSSFRGRWLCLYFYPLDFSFVCPVEVRAFSDLAPAFADRCCDILGGSCDSVFCHLGWVQAKSELRGLRHPLFSDYTKAIAASYAVLDHQTGSPHRATFLIDPQGVIRYASVVDFDVARSPDEVLRVLDSLQEAAGCACASHEDAAAPSAN